MAVKPPGFSASVNERIQRLRGLSAAYFAALQLEPMQSAALWQSVRDLDVLMLPPEVPLWRLSVKSTAPAIPLSGAQLLEWNGALRWVRTDADAALVRDIARKSGGHATLFRARERAADPFHPLPEAMMQLHRRLKQTFDPSGIFNRGRLYPDL